jgi:hypothetical protein
MGVKSIVAGIVIAFFVIIAIFVVIGTMIGYVEYADKASKSGSNVGKPPFQLQWNNGSISVDKGGFNTNNVERENPSRCKELE